MSLMTNQHLRSTLVNTIKSVVSVSKKKGQGWMLHRNSYNKEWNIKIIATTAIIRNKTKYAHAYIKLICNMIWASLIATRQKLCPQKGSTSAVSHLILTKLWRQFCFSSSLFHHYIIGEHGRLNDDSVARNQAILRHVSVVVVIGMMIDGKWTCNRSIRFFLWAYNVNYFIAHKSYWKYVPPTYFKISAAGSSRL